MYGTASAGWWTPRIMGGPPDGWKGRRRCGRDGCSDPHDIQICPAGRIREFEPLGPVHAPGPEAVPDRAPGELAGGAAFDLGDVVEAARDLVGGEALAAVVEERAVGLRPRAVARAGLELDDGANLLAPLRMGDADDAAVGDGGGEGERRLDLRRVGVHAAADDHIGATIAEREVALGVEVADVAEREEVAAAALGGLLGVALVLEGGSGAEVDVARDAGRAGPARCVEDVHLEAGPGPPDRARG